MTDHVTIIPAMGDNYIYLYPCGPGSVFAVDPGVAAPVMQKLEKGGLTLTAIFVTHHHSDHTGGIRQLKDKTGCTVTGPDPARITPLDTVVGDGQSITIGNTAVRTIATPGHTRTGVCYFIEATAGHPPNLFSGDTLFAAGCGRLFECDAATMYESLTKIAALPDETLVYPGHDYTTEDYEFTLSIDPENEKARQFLENARQAASIGRPTVPSALAAEKQTNLFLMAAQPAIARAVNLPDAPPERVFAELRRRKDRF